MAAGTRVMFCNIRKTMRHPENILQGLDELGCGSRGGANVKGGNLKIREGSRGHPVIHGALTPFFFCHHAHKLSVTKDRDTEGMETDC